MIDTVPFFDPAQALNTTETALRQLMRASYNKSYGAAWVERVSTSEEREKWNEREQDERLKRPGVATVPSGPLDYSEFYQLLAIAKKHWEPLAPALGKKATTLPLLEKFERLRNTVGHNRPLLPFEADLLSGIAGLIRNQVTINLSAAAESGEYYPRIESVTDSFGNTLAKSPLHGPSHELAGMGRPEVIIRPGDVLTFSCVAVDPQARELAWTFGIRNAPRSTATVPSGDIAAFTWEVDEPDVGESVSATFTMSAVGARYHRANGFDHRAFFIYKVRPLDHP